MIIAKEPFATHPARFQLPTYEACGASTVTTRLARFRYDHEHDDSALDDGDDLDDHAYSDDDVYNDDGVAMIQSVPHNNNQCRFLSVANKTKFKKETIVRCKSFFVQKSEANKSHE